MIVLAWVALRLRRGPRPALPVELVPVPRTTALSASRAVSDRAASHRPAQLRLAAISVLIPARNEERGIAACVESVLASRTSNSK